jgi:uncharacterized protein YndB with AHSA1/START domain
MEPITVETIVAAPIEKVWEAWNEPRHIIKWAFASPDWHAPYAENDLQGGGKFKTTMAAKDGSNSFDFEGTYTEVREQQLIAYVMSDGRKVVVNFEEVEGGVRVTESFDREFENPVEMQRTGWQSILNNFKTYTESL